MWARLRRRTLSPRRTLAMPRRPLLGALSVVVLVASAAYALYVVFA